MFFSESCLKEIKDAHAAARGKYEVLVDAYLFRDYRNIRAREYAVCGFARRLNTMIRCLDNVFTKSPPDLKVQQEDEHTVDALINIQSFIFNTYGSLDNLAWVWALEKGLLQPDGTGLNKFEIGLRPLQPNYKKVVDSLSPEFRECLNGLCDWFNDLDHFRHALAHQIPLYIPSYGVPKADRERDTKPLSKARLTLSKRRNSMSTVAYRMSRMNWANSDRLPEIRKKNSCTTLSY